MNLRTRHVLDKTFSSLSYLAVGFIAVALLILLGPIVIKGSSAFIFKGTIEHRKAMRGIFEREDDGLDKESESVEAARAPVYEKIAEYEKWLEGIPARERRDRRDLLKDFKKELRHLFGPLPGDSAPVMPRQAYGTTRWDRCLIAYDHVVNIESWDYSVPGAAGTKVFSPRKGLFAGTPLESVFDMELSRSNLENLMAPKLTCYWRFLTDNPEDSYLFGGIRPAVIGTLYLTLVAMLFAAPTGIIAAIYLVEYARESQMISILRSCISTLAGVPSIVFGLFGLAFFINTLGVSDSKSVLAGGLTLGLLILPTIIRASEEAIRAVPHTYKEASVGLGASRWRTVTRVILPAALPGILTGIVISMGRAAGETAPIIFTAAVSVGAPLGISQIFDSPTQALPWGIYNLTTEHEAVDQIRHVQFGMVLTLIAIVLILNISAILLRARVERNLRG
jgi:phosphate transport system permease protein